MGGQEGSDQDRGLVPGHELLAVEVELGAELEGLAEVIEALDRDQLPGPENRRSRTWTGREGDQDPAALVAAIGSLAEVEAGAGDRAPELVHDPEGLAGGARAADQAQLALADQGPAVDAGAYEVDDVEPRSRQLRELEAAAHAVDRGLVVAEAELVLGDEAVEVDPEARLRA